MLDSSPDAMAVVHSGVPVLANAAMCTLLGRPLSQLKKASLVDFVPSAERDRFRTRDADRSALRY